MAPNGRHSLQPAEATAPPGHGVDLVIVERRLRSQLTGHLREFQDAPNFELGEGIRMMNSLMRQAELFPPVFLEHSDRDSFTVTLRNQGRPSIWDQVDGFLETHATIGNPEVRKLLGTDDPTKASRQLRAWVEGGLLVLADASAPRSQRRYMRPGRRPQLDLMSASSEDPSDEGA